MARSFRNITGTFDILPQAYTSDGSRVESSAAWHFVEERLREILEQYGFREIRTPVLEPTELIARGVGEETDIVSKEMFAFERGDTSYVLRPELTAPVIRSYLQHHLGQQGGVQKLFYLGPCFRAERPQKGRYRQFHQFGIEIIGADDARADAEAIAVMMAVYARIGLRDLDLRLNTLGDADSRPRYREALREYLSPFQSELSDTSRRRLETNPLRILDTKIEREQELLADAPVLLDFVDKESRTHYDTVKTLLSDLGIAFSEDPFLVRGLDYYTRTTFELESPHLGAQSSIAGGGRYDLLASELGSRTAVPAVGFAAGMERLFLALEGERIDLPDTKAPAVFAVSLGEAAGRWVFSFAARARHEGLHVEYDLQGRSMKAQMREANRCAASRVVIVGDDELSEGQAIVRDMDSGDQHSVPLDELVEALKSEAG
jgi:histidyl-tRNA synthetase